MAGDAWRDAALALLLQRVSSQNRGRDRPPFDPSLSPTTVAQRSLLADRDDIAALSALAPRAAEAAFALLDGALRSTSRADLFDDDARPRTRPRLLGHVISVVFAQGDGRCLVKVRSGAAGRCSASTPDHIVLLSGVNVEYEGGASGGDDDATLYFGVADGDDAAGGRPYSHCTCRAFEYKHAGETFCKHVLAAGVAIASNLASFSAVESGEFVALLSSSDTVGARPAAP
jgi:hypothetical protein